MPARLRLPRTLPLLLCGVLLALTACSSLQGSGGKGYVTGDGRVATVAVDEREPAIDLAGEDLEGESLDLADLRGKPVVINVWGSWCPPCRAEQPDLNEAAAELGDEATFVGINIRENSADTALAFYRSSDVPYRSLYSPDGKALVPFTGTLTAYSIPATVVLDAEGRIAASIIGSIPTTQTLVDLVNDEVVASE